MSTSDTSRSFDVVLNYIKATFPDFNSMPMKSEWIHPLHCDPNHQLRCHIYDMDASGDIEIHFDLNTDVFQEGHNNVVPKHFLRVLDALILDINQSIYKPSLVEELEIKEVNGNDNFSSIIEQFENQVSENPTQIALRFNEKTYSYKELNEKANQFANWLNQKRNYKKSKSCTLFRTIP